MEHLELLKKEFAERFVGVNPNLDYKSAPAPLEIKVSDDSVIEIPYEDNALLLSCVKWELMPPFVAQGRSGLAELLNPFISDDVRLFNYKLKGVGNREGNVVLPPQDEQYKTVISPGKRSVIVHMGINEDGTFFPVLDPPKPEGGLNSTRGQREFQNARRLFEAKVPAVVPIRWGSYSDIEFDGKNVEFAVLGIPHRETYRTNEFFETYVMPDHLAIHDTLQGLMDHFFDFYKPENGNVIAMKTVCKIAESHAKAMYDFHTKGNLVRFAGHMGNFSYDKERRVSVFHDLDSCVGEEEIHPNAVGLSRIRDLESALFGLAHSLQYSCLHMIVPRDDMRKNNPFKHFLKSYFKGVDTDELGEELLTAYASTLKGLNGRALPDPIMFFNFSTVFPHRASRGMIPLYNQTDAAKQHPIPYGQDQFDTNYANFIKASFPVFNKEAGKIMREA